MADNEKIFISIRIFYFTKFSRTFPIFTGFFSIEFYTFTMSKDRGCLKLEQVFAVCQDSLADQSTHQLKNFTSKILLHSSPPVSKTLKITIQS